MITADVESLYPSIPIDDCIIRIELMVHKFFKDEIKLAKLLIKLLEWVLKNNYVNYDGRVYLQM